MRISSPYATNYTIFAHFKKDDWLCHLANHESHFFILIKEEIEQLFLRTGNYLKYLNFDDLYSLAVEVTVSQFNKNIIKKTDWFFGLCDDNKMIYKKIKSRIVNNCRNLFDKKRKINVLNLEAHFKNECSEFYEIDSNFDDLLKIAKTEPIKFKEALKSLYFDLDFDDFENLAKLGGFSNFEILGFDPSEMPKFRQIKSENGNTQLTLNFEDKD